MVKKQKHQLLDDQMFRQEMTGVVPLKTAPTTDSKAPRSVHASRKPEGFSSSPDLSYPASADEQRHIDAEDGSSHRKNGIRKRTIQKLKRGHYKVGAELDLHNMTMETGRTALLEFIAEAQSGSLESDALDTTMTSCTLASDS